MNHTRSARRIPFYAGILLLLALGLMGCRQSALTPQNQPEMQIELVTEPNPPRVGVGTVTVNVHDAQGNVVENATVTVRGDMSHAGMQPVFGEAQPSAGGVYPFEFNWNMGGDWYLTVTVALSDGTQVERTFDFAAVQ